jgi:hypothetical protein
VIFTSFSASTVIKGGPTLRANNTTPKGRQYQPAQESLDMTFQVCYWKDKVIDGGEDYRSYFWRVHSINSIETLVAMKISAEASHS